MNGGTYFGSSVIMINLHSLVSYTTHHTSSATVSLQFSYVNIQCHSSKSIYCLCRITEHYTGVQDLLRESSSSHNITHKDSLSNEHRHERTQHISPHRFKRQSD